MIELIRSIILTEKQVQLVSFSVRLKSKFFWIRCCSGALRQSHGQWLTSTSMQKISLGNQWGSTGLGDSWNDIQSLMQQNCKSSIANNFNEATINDYFNKLEELEACFIGGIPPEHKWNMDEKGVQMGGGRKNSSKKFLY